MHHELTLVTTHDTIEMRRLPMPTITIPDDTYASLVRYAAIHGTTPEGLALPVIERAARIYERTHIPTPADPSPLTGYAWQQQFAEFNQAIQAEAARYPSGFRLDDSREAMYEGCGE
jgi:hypothetical protein